MNIWVEYFKDETKTTNTHAQMKEQVKWNPPDQDKIMKRFCQDRNEAIIFANSMISQGYCASIKTDGSKS